MKNIVKCEWSKNIFLTTLQFCWNTHYHNRELGYEKLTTNCYYIKNLKNEINWGLFVLD